jgi:FixJ family two-component response regulator
MVERVTILVVDDDASMRRSLVRLLRVAGYECLDFGSAEELLQAPQVSRSMCVVADVNLPGMSGYDLVRTLRDHHGRMPAVFITAYDTPAVRREATTCENAAFLAKPFEGHALLDAIRRVTTAVP